MKAYMLIVLFPLAVFADEKKPDAPKPDAPKSDSPKPDSPVQLYEGRSAVQWAAILRQGREVEQAAAALAALGSVKHLIDLNRFLVSGSQHQNASACAEAMVKIAGDEAVSRTKVIGWLRASVRLGVVASSPRPARERPSDGVRRASSGDARIAVMSCRLLGNYGTEAKDSMSDLIRVINAVGFANSDLTAAAADAGIAIDPDSKVLAAVFMRLAKDLKPEIKAWAEECLEKMSEAAKEIGK